MTDKEILKPINVDYEMNFEHLLSYINGLYTVNEEAVKELKEVVKGAIKRVKETGDAVLINWCGHFDLLVTENRLHVILIHKTFELPTWLEE